jgi:NADPH-dependent ferric siderophore reductase
MTELKARAAIPFRNVAKYVDAIVESLTAHNLELRSDEQGFAVTSPFGGMARLLPAEAELHLFVEASDPAAFNRLKHDLTSLIDFTARDEALEISWRGDTAGTALPPDLRVARVREIRDITPKMRRVTFEGEDLHRFAVSDQLHCRLLFQAKGAAEFAWPQLDDNGRIAWPSGGKLATRIYTIRRVDAVRGTLDVDFVRHGATGPGTRWAEAATPGDVVGILGPAAQGPKPADWYLLAGDETGLPGIARILEDLPLSARGIALVEVAETSEEQPLRAPPGVEVRWLHRGGAAPGTTRLLADAVRAVNLPADQDRLFFWAGAEFSAYREMRTYMRKEIGVPPSRLVAFSHWRRGMSEEDIADAGAAAISA